MQVAPPQLPPSSPRTPQAGMTPLMRRVLRTLISDFITTFYSAPLVTYVFGATDSR